jgi:hypothetical protein
MLALFNHALVEFAAFKEDFPVFRDYNVLGDDVTIMEKNVANRYIRLCSEIGLDISFPKSFHSEGNPGFGEMAKRLFLNGQEITPVPVQLSQKAMKNKFMFLTY